MTIETEYLREQFNEREKELSLLTRSNTIMMSGLDMQRKFDSFVEELRKLVDISWAAVILTVDVSLYFMALSSKIGSAWQVGEQIPIKGTGTEWVVTHKEAIVESDLSQESRFITGECYLRQRVRSVAYLPLITMGEAIGNLVVASCKPNAYSQRHTDILAQLASQAAMPIKHSRQYAEIHEKARIDEVTGLFNRRSLDEMIVNEINRHSRYGGVFSLIILGLSPVNDKYEHLVGEGLLKKTGCIMKNIIRSADQAFRYGDGEFAILLPNTSIDDANQVAERLQKQLTSDMGAKNIRVNISLGLASWPTDGLVTNEVIKAAHAAFYHARQSGGNRSQYASRILLLSDYTKTGSANSQDDEPLSAVYALAAIVDAKSYYNSSHWRKVKHYVTVLAKALNMEPASIERLQTCALLHDIGKIVISDKIINKRDRLTDDEWKIIRNHSRVGANIVSHARQLAPYLLGVLYHHEMFNGSGYPEGLHGEHIPLDARMMGIADAFAAMTANRSYSDALTLPLALEEIKRGAGTQFDSNLIEVFIPAVQNTLLLPQER